MEDAPAKTRQGMNRLFEDAQTSPLKLAGVQAGGQSWGMCLIGWEWSRDQDSGLSLVESWGMFCVVRGSKVTDWVMCGIFAYWPSWSVSVNKELKPLISQTISLSVVSGDMDGAQEDIAFHILNTRLQSPSPGIVLHSHHSDYLCLHPTWIPVQMLITTALIFSKFLVREDWGCEICHKRWH